MRIKEIKRFSKCLTFEETMFPITWSIETNPVTLVITYFNSFVVFGKFL